MIPLNKRRQIFWRKENYFSAILSIFFILEKADFNTALMGGKGGVYGKRRCRDVGVHPTTMSSVYDL
jgi:hypothetical protein